MARLIDADELYRKLEEIRMDYLEEDSMNSNFAANVIECMQDVYLKDMPIIKAERYGHWTLIKDIFCYYSCSECGNNVQYESRFCPYCGAVMKDEAVVCCEKCKKYDSVGNGWGICREFDISSLVFRTEEDYCSRGVLKKNT